MKNKKGYYGLFKKIYPYIKGKRVLDVGCVGHEIEREGTRLWVHKFLKNNCEVIGIDILKKEVEELRKRGYEAYCKNAENFEFNKKFDVIFAGELIEHLSNPGLFLKQAKKHLKEEGFLILSTPNSFNLQENFFNLLFLRINPPVNSEHTCYYTPKTIRTLLEREGFKPIDIIYYDFYGSLIGRIKYVLLKSFGPIFKRRFVIICKLKELK